MIIKKQQKITCNNIEPLEVPCSQNLHKLIITNPSFSGNLDNVIFIRCCLKDQENESLYTQNIDEFSKLNKIDLHNIINSVNYKVSKNHDFSIIPYGCKTTKQICDYEKFKINYITVSIQYKCNLKCIMCAHGRGHAYDNLDDLKYKNCYFNTLYNIKGLHLDTIQLTERGEPFFYKKETMEYIKSLTSNDCKTLYIISNLTTINENDIRELYEYSQKNNIKILITASCSGITNETYKTIHKNNFFNKIVNNIKLLRELDMLCNINYVIQEENYFELELLKDFWKDNGIEHEKLTINLKDHQPLPDSVKMKYIEKYLKEFQL